MIGPTGVGKTEIARRLAKLAGAPFIKVEATKFTEVGYVGRDVESIIRDLAEAAVKMLRDEQIKQAEPRAFEAAEDRVLEALLPSARDADSDENSSTRQLFRKKLREGELDDKEVEMEVQATTIGVEIMAPPGMEEMTSQLQNMFSSMAPGKNKSKKMTVKDAMRRLPTCVYEHFDSCRPVPPEPQSPVFATPRSDSPQGGPPWCRPSQPVQKSRPVSDSPLDRFVL